MGENSSELALLVKRTLTNPRPPRRPFIAGLFPRHISGQFAFIGSRDEGHRTSRIEERPHTRRQLRGGENREKSGGQIKWLSTSYSTGGCTCSPLQWAPVWVAPPFQRRRGPPGSAPSSITASRAAVGTEEDEVDEEVEEEEEEEEGGASDSGGRTPGGHQQRQDGWLTRKKQHTRHPSSLTHPETREETNEGD